ncbi:MAG: hypothetical protein HY403_04415 [Elusimicrobia bacterium]|nr:hypothetical protein [Elusimicrobiota bacterium]
MAAKALPPQVGEAMLRRGAVVAFGPDYLDNSLLMRQELRETLEGKAVLSCEKIGDLLIPDGPMLNCAMIFFHRLPSSSTMGAWKAALLEGVALASQPPRGLEVEDASPEEPVVEWARAGGADGLQLILTWFRPLESSHCVRTARALERSYLENGGRYGRPGLFRRLRGLFF